LISGFLSVFFHSPHSRSLTLPSPALRLLLERAVLENSAAAIKLFVERENPDVIALTETWLKAAPGNQSQLAKGKGAVVVSKMDRDTKEKWLIKKALEPGGVFGEYRAWFSCHETKRASGCMLLVKKSVRKPTSVEYNLPTFRRAPAVGEGVDSGGGAGAGGLPRHHPDGRIIMAEWESWTCLLTYTPNHGSEVTSSLNRLCFSHPTPSPPSSSSS
jgi:exonuclease III